MRERYESQTLTINPSLFLKTKVFPLSVLLLQMEMALKYFLSLFTTGARLEGVSIRGIKNIEISDKNMGSSMARFY